MYYHHMSYKEKYLSLKTEYTMLVKTDGKYKNKYKISIYGYDGCGHFIKAQTIAANNTVNNIEISVTHVPWGKLKNTEDFANHVQNTTLKKYGTSPLIIIENTNEKEEHSDKHYVYEGGCDSFLAKLQELQLINQHV